jgi:hypothetical protein
MQIFISIIASTVIVLVSLFGAYQWLPMKFLDPLGEPQFGTSITQIQGSDTLSASRTVINNNFSALNTGKIESSTTTLPLITTLANLSTVGTITTGIWTGTAINVNKGGTGSTTLAIGQVLLGSSTNAIGVVSGFGTSGQFLTSNGAGKVPTWQSSAIDQGINYTWTGQHIFNASTTFNATSTFDGRITSNNASTTIYNDLLVMGSIKTNTYYYGVPRTCRGMTSFDGTTGTGQVVITCGFRPSIIQLDSVAPGSASDIWSKGVSDSATSSAIYNIDLVTSQIVKSTSTSSIALEIVSGGSNYQVHATAAPTATGFTIDYSLLVWDAQDPVVVNYLAY